MTAIVVTGADLHEAAAWASRITPAKPPMPLLAGLLLDAADELTVTAFDLDTRGTVTVPAIVKEPGRLLVSAKLLTAVAKTVNRDVDVTIQDVRGVAEVRSGRSEWAVPLMPADNYPQLPDVSEVVAGVDAATLQHALRRVLPATSREASHDLEWMRGVLIEPNDHGGLTLVATDRYRLAAADIPAECPVDMVEAVVPADVLDAALHATITGDVQLAMAGATFGLTAAEHRIVGRQIADRFARWRGMIPAAPTQTAVVDVAGLARAIAQAEVMSPNPEAAMRLEFGDDAVEVSCLDGDRRASAAVELESMAGDATAVLVKAGFLRTALTTMESTLCTIDFHKRMIVLRPCDADGAALDGFLHLVMYRAGERK